MRLLLIRHGQTPANVRGLLATARPGPGLTRLGRKQAAALAIVLADAVAGEQIAAIYVSPLTRTAETAAPLAASLGLDPQVLEGLEEIEAGDLEDRRDMPSVMVYVRTVFGWAAGDLDVRMPGADRRIGVLRALRRGDRGGGGAASGCHGRHRLARCRDPGLVGVACGEPQRGLHRTPPPRQHRRRGSDRLPRGRLARRDLDGRADRRAREAVNGLPRRSPESRDDRDSLPFWRRARVMGS